MSSSTVETSRYRRKGRKTVRFEAGELDIDKLLETAENYWGENYEAVEEDAKQLLVENGRKTYDLHVSGDEKVKMSFRYRFDSSKQSVDQNVEDLWDLHVEPVIDTARNRA